MTWALGGTHIGCCRCIADIQATFIYPRDKIIYLDIVQKIHEISQNIMIAFAGDIKIALKIVEKLKLEISKDKYLKKQSQPEIVANDILKYIRFLYNEHFCSTGTNVHFLIFIGPDDACIKSTNKFVQENEKLCKDLFLHGEISYEYIKALEKYDIPSRASESINKFITIKATSPKFIPENIKAPLFGQVGSGSQIDSFQKIVKKYQYYGFSTKSENGEKPDLIIPTGRKIAEYIALMAQDISAKGISQNMHTGLISPNSCTIKPFTVKSDFPRTVDNWDDFKKMAKEKGVFVAGCRAIA